MAVVYCCSKLCYVSLLGCFIHGCTIFFLPRLSPDRPALCVWCISAAEMQESSYTALDCRGVSEASRKRSCGLRPTLAVPLYLFVEPVLSDSCLSQRPVVPHLINAPGTCQLLCSAALPVGFVQVQQPKSMQAQIQRLVDDNSVLVLATSNCPFCIEVGGRPKCL